VPLPFGHQGTIGVELEGAGPPDWDHPFRVIPFEGAPAVPYVRNMRGAYASLRFVQIARRFPDDFMFPISLRS